MKNFLLVATVLLTHCARSPPSAQVMEDRSIVFPKFYEQAPVAMTRHGELYQLDGVILVAISIAANDFAPRNRENIPCWERQEAYRYRFVRQGDIVLVRIDHDASYCKNSLLIMDGGAQYAIGLDGRILRRVFDGEPAEPFPSPDSGVQRSSGEPIPFSDLGNLHGEPDPAFLEMLKRRAESMRLDAGVPPPQAPDGGSVPSSDGGAPVAPDGGV